MTTEVEDKTEFKFSELSDQAKNRARDEYRSGDYPGYDWWDCTYEDAVRMGALIGIYISTTTRTTTKGIKHEETDISFSGFCSQGDGALFEGNYRYVPDAVAKVTSETNDEELIRIAQELTLLQLTRRLRGLEPFSATISPAYSRGSYSHSGMMVVDVNSEDEDDEHNEVGEELETDVTQLMRDFADYIYKQLEAQHNYLTSDEYIDERLGEDDALYDEDGDTI